MTALWTAEEAAQATGGRTTGDWQAHGVSIDSRTIQPGDLFVALQAERDGHDFVADALAGDMNINVSTDPIGTDTDCNAVYLKDIWPTAQEVAELVAFIESARAD